MSLLRVVVVVFVVLLDAGLVIVVTAGTNGSSNHRTTAPTAYRGALVSAGCGRLVIADFFVEPLSSVTECPEADRVFVPQVFLGAMVGLRRGLALILHVRALVLWKQACAAPTPPADDAQAQADDGS